VVFTRLSSEALPQTDENRTENVSPQSRRGHRDNPSFFFVLNVFRDKEKWSCPLGKV